VLPCESPRHTLRFMEFSPKRAWTREQVFVQVRHPSPARIGVEPVKYKNDSAKRSDSESSTTRKMGSGSSKAERKQETFQRPTSQTGTHKAPTTRGPIADALVKFGLPCTNANQAPSTVNYAPPLSAPETWREVPHNMWVEEMHHAFEGGSLHPSMVHSCQNFQNQNHEVVPPILNTSPMGSGPHQASLQLPAIRPSELRAAQARHTPEALVGITTLLVRNIPARYSQQDLLERVWLPNGTYNLLFLPHSFKRNRSVGYTIINFTNSAYAQKFHRRWHGRKLADGSTTRPLSINAAPFQGFYDNMKYMSTSKVSLLRHSEFQPCVLHGAIRIDFKDALQSLGLLGS